MVTVVRLESWLTASSVHGVLVHLGHGGALGALSDSAEPSLLEELPLVSLEAISVVSSVPWLTRSQGCSPMCHWCWPHCYRWTVQYQAHCHDPPLAALRSPALEWHRRLESSGQREAAGGGLGSCGVSRSLNGMYLVPSTGLSLKVTALSAGHLKQNLQQYLVLN